MGAYIVKPLAPQQPKLKDQKIKKGGDFTYKWVVDEEVDGKWKKDDQPLRPSDRIKFDTSDAKVFKVTIANVEEDDEGEYTLELSNRWGKTSGSANVTVLIPQPKPTAPQLEDKRVRKGEDATFVWEVDYEVKGKWKRDGYTLEDGGRIRIQQLQDPRCFKLTITNVEEEDEGEYTLELFNSEGQEVGSANLTVLVPPPIAKLKDKSVRIGEDITFSWKADKEVTGQWKKDGSPLIGDDRIRMQQLEEPRQFTLTITDAEEDDGGVYTLELSNSDGKTSGSATLTVSVPPPMPSAPQLKDKRVKKGEDATFIWEAGYEVRGKWKKDDETLEDGGRIRIQQLEDPRCFKLTITNVEEDDEGEYTLELSNSEGQESGSANLTVLIPPVKPMLEDKHVKKGEDIIFSWKTENEVHGTWKKDDCPLEDDGRIKIQQPENTSHFNLTITNAKKEDEGQYTLVLSNSDGQVSGSAKVLVSPPKLTKPQLKDANVKSGEDIILSWEAGYEVHGTWKKDNVTLEDSERITIQELEEPRSFKLTITNAEEDDEGTYTLVLSNSEGKEAGSAKVNVLEYNKEWRQIAWGSKEEMVKRMSEYPVNEKVKNLHFLLFGPVGAGKSSIINSINTTFLKRTSAIATAGSAYSLGQSQTTIYKTYKVQRETTVLPFAFSDTMGLEKDTNGVKTSDIIKALKGQLTENFQFGQESPEVNTNPTLDDKVHCLIYVIPAHQVSSLLKEQPKSVIKKMHEVRKAASDLGIPQVVFMTHVDLCCPLVKEDVKYIYRSKQIKETMQSCTTFLGVPMNCIFPVQNYHEENNADEATDCVILDGVRNIANLANDYVGRLQV